MASLRLANGACSNDRTGWGMLYRMFCLGAPAVAFPLPGAGMLVVAEPDVAGTGRLVLVVEIVLPRFKMNTTPITKIAAIAPK